MAWNSNFSANVDETGDTHGRIHDKATESVTGPVGIALEHIIYEHYRGTKVVQGVVYSLSDWVGNGAAVEFRNWRCHEVVQLYIKIKYGTVGWLPRIILCQGIWVFSGTTG